MAPINPVGQSVSQMPSGTNNEIIPVANTDVTPIVNPKGSSYSDILNPIVDLAQRAFPIPSLLLSALVPEAEASPRRIDIDGRQVLFSSIELNPNGASGVLEEDYFLARTSDRQVHIPDFSVSCKIPVGSRVTFSNEDGMSILKFQLPEGVTSVVEITGKGEQTLSAGETLVVTESYDRSRIGADFFPPRRYDAVIISDTKSEGSLRGEDSNFWSDGEESAPVQTPAADIKAPTAESSPFRLPKFSFESLELPTALVGAFGVATIAHNEELISDSLSQKINGVGAVLLGGSFVLHPAMTAIGVSSYEMVAAPAEKLALDLGFEEHTAKNLGVDAGTASMLTSGVLAQKYLGKEILQRGLWAIIKNELAAGATATTAGEAGATLAVGGVTAGTAPAWAVGATAVAGAVVVPATLYMDYRYFTTTDAELNEQLGDEVKVNNAWGRFLNGDGFVDGVAAAMR